MSNELISGIEQAYSERTDLLVVALTGRTGSGCSTTADIMCKDFADIPVAIESMAEPEKRKMGIIHDFAAIKWVPFRKITISTLILSYLLQEDWKSVETFLRSKKTKSSQIPELESIFTDIISDSKYESFAKLTRDGEKDFAIEGWAFYQQVLIPQAANFKKACGSSYSTIFQSLGDNLRFSGSALSSEINSNELFSLIRRAKRLAKAAFLFDRSLGIRSTRVVIDAIRNPLELVYLRDQFAAFYAIAITADDGERRSRLLEGGSNKRDIDILDEKEYSKKALTNYAQFVSQNIKDCIQKSDIFFTNSGKLADFAQTILAINHQVVRYVSLMLRPGLVTPTQDERCMQLAFVAKLNSGCVSRQVGAAVSDANHSVKSVGWNDVPKGQISCLLRDVSKLLSTGDNVAFSDYEKGHEPFRRHLRVKFQNRNSMKATTGLSCAYCFKDAYNEFTIENNQVHTRSLHAEENAFLQLAKHGNSGIAGGFLYTTASPCELCSKKAFQLGIEVITYVDPYPGISSTHVLMSGVEGARPRLKLFSGAIGPAYHRLYEAILPIKDEYMARLSGAPQVALL